MPDAASENATNATTSSSAIPPLNSTPPANGAASTRTFLTHCLGRIVLSTPRATATGVRSGAGAGSSTTAVVWSGSGWPGSSAAMSAARSSIGSAGAASAAGSADGSAGAASTGRRAGGSADPASTGRTADGSAGFASAVGPSGGVRPDAESSLRVIGATSEVGRRRVTRRTASATTAPSAEPATTSLG